MVNCWLKLSTIFTFDIHSMKRMVIHCLRWEKRKLSTFSTNGARKGCKTNQPLDRQLCSASLFPCFPAL